MRRRSGTLERGMRLSRGMVCMEGNKFNLFALARAAGTPGQYGPVHRETVRRISPHKISGAEAGTNQKPRQDSGVRRLVGALKNRRRVAALQKKFLMKILFYNHTGQVSGAERVLLMVLARLDRRRFNPVMICPEQGPLLSLATSLGVPVQSIPGLDARFTWRLDHLLRYLK